LAAKVTAMNRMLLAAALVSTTLSLDTSAQWPQWRGPVRDGSVPKGAVPETWPDDLRITWTRAVGEGYSSPVVEGGRVHVHSREGDDEVVTALDLVTGSPVWTDRYRSAFSKNKYANSMSRGPFSTPLVAGGRLFTLGSSAVLTAYDAVSGNVLWRRDWSGDVDTSRLFTGTAMSPLLDGGLLIVHVGDDRNGAFRAVDPATGAERWALPGHGPGYASPIVASFGGTRQLVTLTDRAAVGVAVGDGRELWQIPFPDEWNENIVTPVVAGDILVISGTRQGTFGYRIEKSETGFAPRRIWHNADLPMYMSSPVVVEHALFGFSNRRKGQLFCLDVATGAARWTTDGRAGANASLQKAGEAILALTTEGDLLVLRASAEKYDEIRRYKIPNGETWAQPVLLGDRLLVRHGNSVSVWALQ